MSEDFSLAIGSFLVTRALAAVIISLVGGLFVKLFTKKLFYSSAYLLFFWALARGMALAIALRWIADYAKLHDIPIVGFAATTLGMAALFLLPSYLINRDLPKYGVTENATIGIGGKSMLATATSFVIIGASVYFISTFL